ncbi:hypothetical protein QJS83_14330 [Bdellovibrio sp. 22V]|uniref:hypothetical protein n=1 Tax=Bdellovibrio TaxID=958 RepID=UPI002543ACDB|nr:hypothetical protein [Bdellovibrio sp. 22V]WII71642.1 hypothetical protein QJS83_14330 [Bdellovibrio sp. 22V]
METLKKKNLSFPAKTFTRVLAALGIMLALAACQKDSGGSPVIGVGINNCANCVGVIPQPVVLTTYQSKSTDGNVVFQNMQILVQSTGIQPNATGNTWKYYRGPIYVQGTMVVTTPQYDYYPGTNYPITGCVIPAGTYQVQSTTVGQMDYDGVNIVLPSLVTVGGGITMSVEAPYPMGLVESGSRLYAAVKVTSVNGIACSSNFFGTFN